MILIQFLKNQTWSNSGKIVTSVLVSLVLAVAQLYLEGKVINVTTLVANLTVIFTVATVLYKTYFGQVQWMTTLGKW